MFKRAMLWCLLAVVPMVAYGEERQLVFEDFESGLGGWTVGVYASGGPTNDTPLVFDENGQSSGDPIHGSNAGYPGSHSAGFSSNLSPWDGSQPQWIEKRWTVAPGTYDVTFTVDAYVYWWGQPEVVDCENDPYAGNPWGVGNRMYVLTDDQYADPQFDYDNGDVGPGFKADLWPGWKNDTCDWSQNGVWQHISTTWSMTTTTGNVLVRLLYHEKDGGQQSAVWDNVHLDLKQGETTVLTFDDGFESGLGAWTALNWRQTLTNNDTPVIFSSVDPLLYANVNNNGSHSAGFSSDLDVYDETGAAWLQKLMPGVVDPGKYDYHLEFDRYVSRGGPSNGTPIEIPASGAGLTGPNTGYPGSKAVGYSSNKSAPDIPRGHWIQMQFPNTGITGTVLATIEMDLYIHKEDTDGQDVGNRLFVLTGDKYNNPGWNFTDDAAPGWRKSYYTSFTNGEWQSITYSKEIDSDGNIELRLLWWEPDPGAQSVAWDNVRLTVGGTQLVFEDFEDGLAGWTALSRIVEDEYSVGNRVYVLTDDQYSDPSWNYDQEPIDPGLSLSYWPGVPDFSLNGVWHHETYGGEFITTTGDIELRLLHHDKNTGAQAVAWDNVVFTIISPCNPVRFDADGDGDVDQTDFAVFQACYTGPDDPGNIYNAVACQCMNADGTVGGVADVDSIDLQAFEACASGPGIAANADCDDGPR